MSKHDILKQSCPHCGVRYQIARTGLTKKGKCHSCGKEFEVTGYIAKQTRQIRRALERELAKKEKKAKR